jgi:uncharacterized damage-inducible protein DinB
MLTRPASDEFAPYYAGYIGLVPEGDVRRHLRLQLQDTLATLSGVPDEKAEKGYGPGKWSLKEVVGHLSDAERVFAYRLLRIARGDKTALPGFEQDDWIPLSRANARTLASLLLEFAAVREATLQLVESLDDAAWVRRGTASEKEISARALAYVCAGHEIHHLGIIRERYLA